MKKYNLLSHLFNRKSQGVVPTDEQLAHAKKYKRVVIFGMDGAGDYFDKCDVPNFQKVFGSGAVSFTALSQYPTISAQNWASVLHGVRYQKHKITNEEASSQNYVDPTYPSVFKAYGDRHKGCTLASIVNWYPINKGIVETDLSGVYKISGGEVYMGEDDDYAMDKAVCDTVVDFVQKKDPTILFTHFDAPDHAGHSHGYGSETYKEATILADGFLGRIYDAYVERGWEKDTLFILVTDHGHIRGERGGHGHWAKTERTITIAVAGALGDIIPGKNKMGKASTPDIAAICFYALGEKQPESWECGVPTGIFNTL